MECGKCPLETLITWELNSPLLRALVHGTGACRRISPPCPSPATLNTRKLLSGNQGQQLKPQDKTFIRIMLGIIKKHSLAKFHYLM